MLQVLTESMAVAIVGGVLGCLAADRAGAWTCSASAVFLQARKCLSASWWQVPLALGGGLLAGRRTCRERRASTTTC